MTVIVDLGPFNLAMAEIEHVAPRAALWAMREAGRHVVAQARQNEQRHNLTGALWSSIKPSREITASGGLTVGPRGLPGAYGPKIEALDPFMAPAFAAVSAEYPGICEDAMSTALYDYGI